MLEIKNMTYKIPKGRAILENLSLTIWEGEFLGILGKNGAGKTTLLDLMMGLRPVTQGEISFFKQDPQFFTNEVSQQIFFLSQDIKIPRAMSIREYLDYISFFYDRYDKKKESFFMEYFEMDPKSKVGGLSTGQQKKVQIIAALSCNAKLIIIDEITAVLDPESRLKFFKALEKIHQTREQSIILATNIAEDLVGRVDRVLFLKRGKATYHDSQEIHNLFGLGEVA